jgi:hypothetical protein
MPLSTGTCLAPYEILAPIGADGTGEIYKARGTRLGLVVAVRVSGDKFSERLERGARAVAAVNCPNLRQLYDVEPNYLGMESVNRRFLINPVLDSAATPLTLLQNSKPKRLR